MDQTQEQMKFIGFFGIFRESYKTIFSWKKIFSYISLTFILPLTLIFIAHLEISGRLFFRIEHNPFAIFTGPEAYQEYRYTRATAADWLRYSIFKLAVFAFLTLFALLSTAAVVYTIASVYAARDVTFKKILKVVPKVWKRLSLTFLCMFLAFFLYNLVAGVVVFIWGVTVAGGTFGIILLSVFLALYVFGFLYLSLVWQLGSVVSVLETSYGFKAMMKAKNLVKGKRGPAIGVGIVLYGFLIGFILLYMAFVQYDYDLAMIWRVLIGFWCCFFMMCLFLVLEVSQTVLYLVCKSHHRETIDKLSLSTYLGAYLEESSQPGFKVGEDIQLGQPRSGSGV